MLYGITLKRLLYTINFEEKLKIYVYVEKSC